MKELFSISKIITLLYFEFSRNFVFSGEQQDFWEFVYVDKGELIIVADTSEYLLKTGEMAFHKPNEFHSLRANGSIAPNIVVVSFECKNSTMNFFENKILFLDKHEKFLLTQIIKEGLEVFNIFPKNPPIMGMKRKIDTPLGAEQMIKLYLELLLIHIFRRKDTIYKHERYTLSPQQHYETGLTQDIIGYLKSNIFKNITLDDICKHFKVSKSTIKKIFKNQTGKSAIDFFIDLKIDEAKRLIKQEELNFTQIADKLGYNSVHYFSRIFKSRTQMTPTEYSLSVRM